jgi:hypothetical protein
MEIHSVKKNNKMGQHTCKYCYRNYKKKENYDKHIVCCEFFYRSQREHDNEMDSYESIPSQRELYNLVRELAFECGKLRQEVAKLKNTSTTQTRKLISDVLKQPNNIPSITFIDWAKQFVIERQHLDVVFENDLTQGIKECIKTMASKLEPNHLPLRSFAQKQNTIYVYKNENGKNSQWYTMSNDDLDKFISAISYKFLQEYMKYQATLSDKLKIDNEEKEKQMVYMMKINGKGSDDRRKNDIKKMLYNKFQQTIKNATTIDFI